MSPGKTTQTRLLPVSGRYALLLWRLLSSGGERVLQVSGRYHESVLMCSPKVI